MVPSEFSSLLYFRRFPGGGCDCAAYYLFDGSSLNKGFFPLAKTPLEWQHPCEFSSVDYGEPLECVHARRTAFGGSTIRIASNLETPDRALIFATPNQRMDAYGYVSIRWKLTGVLEVPQAVISSATSDQLRVQWGFGESSMEMLRAAATLTPHQYDVFGFCTPDQRLVGAVEFTGQRVDDVYEAHLFAVANGRELSVGDELWGYYTSTIGETKVEVRRLLAVVERIPGLPVPRFERPLEGLSWRVDVTNLPQD